MVYSGIFIDEMQQLKDEWKLALYDLLDDNKYMIMVGDYNQEIRPKDKNEYKEEEDLIFLEIDEDDKNDANIYYLGDIKFKKIILNKNYRNTIQITEGVNRLIRELKKYKTEFNYIERYDNSNVVLGISTKSGEKPEYIYAMDASSLKIKIKEIILHLIENKGIEQEEIIILYPPNFTDNEDSKIYNNKTCGKISKATIEKIIKDELNLEFNDLTEGRSKVRNTGIKLSTIGKAIGLDFKAVIIFGLYNIRASREKNIVFDNVEKIRNSDVDTKREVINSMKNIYVAASRAREYIYIIDDIDGTTKNIISEYVKKIGEKNG